ncbi:MAG: MBL fold metallo-hydrolase [Candidatus Omnitrophica bacterium]|nr:MBL fold metallo-hydrolase [Candidatus Omnitrophota bacterium]
MKNRLPRSRKENKVVVKTLVVGPLATNCYIVSDQATGETCLIDPGSDPSRIKEVLRKDGLKAKFIINTHGHGDHIAANGAFGIPIYIHRLDSDFLDNPDKNLSRMFFFGIKSPKASRLLEDGERIGLGNIEFEVIHTPGHTPGSISLKVDDVVFTGDALFAGSIGRTDFDYGDESLLIKSINARLLTLSDDTVIYPGHGEPSTIGKEKNSNPFLI